MSKSIVRLRESIRAFAMVDNPLLSSAAKYLNDLAKSVEEEIAKAESDAELKVYEKISSMAITHSSIEVVHLGETYIVKAEKKK